MEIRKIMEKIRPPPSELREVKEIASELLKKLGKATNREVVLAGSVAKGTFIAGEGDIDIFVLFKKKIEKERMKKYLENAFKKAFPGVNYQMNYAEHPYIRFHYKGRRADVVPAYKMGAGQRVFTAVDRSVLHTKFVLKNLREKQKDEVRLLKKFLKAAELYGAEIKTEGFSGYLCELLIIKYKSFANLMRAASGWKLPLVIDQRGYWKKTEHPFLFKKFNKSLVVIDPTDKNRNVAAPLSESNLRKFMRLARQFLKNPAEKYFFQQPSFDEKLKRLRKKGFVTIIRLPKPEVVDDVLWGQIKKLSNALAKGLESYLVKEIIAEADREITIAIGSRNVTAGGLVEIRGPPLELKEHVSRFVKAHKKNKLLRKKGIMVAVDKKPKKDIIRAVEEILKENEPRFKYLPLKNAKISFLD